MKHITQDQFIIKPWKNGSGITTEMYLNSNFNDDDFNLRLSCAKIDQDGPFSFYKDIDRCLIILKGNGCLLTHPEKTCNLTQASEPFFFFGEEVFHCELINGEVLDFNLMINRKWGKANVVKGSSLTKFKVRCSSDLLLFFDTSNFELYELDKAEEIEINPVTFISVAIMKAII